MVTDMLDRTRTRTRTRDLALHRIASRKYRARVKACKLVVNVEVDAGVIDWLINVTRWLDASAADDRKAIGNAISAGLAVSARALKPDHHQD